MFALLKYATKITYLVTNMNHIPVKMYPFGWDAGVNCHK